MALPEVVSREQWLEAGLRLDRGLGAGGIMTESAASADKIFVSYRRDDSAYPAGWLVDRLVGRFGAAQVLKDVDSIQLGDDFERDIMAAVGSCSVLLAVIGARRLTVTGKDGRRRIDDPADYVRLEIESALARDVRVIPVLVDGARMPTAADLPPSLDGLARRQALELSPGSFDTSRLFEVLDRTLTGTTPAGRDDPANSLPGMAHGRADATVWQDRGKGAVGEPGTSDRGSIGGQSRPVRRRHGRVLTVAVAGVILAAAGIAAAVLASSPPAVKHPPAAASGHASSAAPATGFTVCTEPVVSCADAMQAEPASITPSADGAVYIKDLKWSNWGSATAVGSGTLERDNCQPSCANGTDVPYPVTVTLSDLTPYGDGEQAYAIMTISTPGNSYNETFSKGLVP